MNQPIEIWAGVEATVNRVGDVYFDQLQLSGHCDRPEDLDLFARLGVKALRYPVLWERTPFSENGEPDWQWADQRLNRLRELGIRPIVGLLHHGSGPAHTSLVDPGFPEKLAAYALAVARRYPWVEAYTPVNEPLTTARFSGLYGHWYPHGKQEDLFMRALYNQVRGTQLAMKAIRTVNPEARLVQTEDLGKTYATQPLSYQADFENTRRWLSLDMLVGRLTPRHSLWDYCMWAGLPEEELVRLHEERCPPDILGLNYYVTSERFLDHRLEHYPAFLHGGNGQHAYADVEVARVCPEGIAGAASMLSEAWDRYGLPLAVTEVHLGSTRDEQLRWWMEVWNSVQALKETGVDVRAVTAWSLLGSYNWHCLVTRDENHYESGVFDLRSRHPRPTVLAQAITSLANGEEFDHPVLDTPGWWQRPERILYPPASRRDELAYLGAASSKTKPANKPSRPRAQQGARPILIAGKTGALAQGFQRICDLRGLEYRLVSRSEMDITNPRQVAQVLEDLAPWAVINAAGYRKVDRAEIEPVLCSKVNVRGAANLAKACAQRDIPLVAFSTDLVFDGQQNAPYIESASLAPLNVFGRSKAEAERIILDAHTRALVIRTCAFFDARDSHNYAAQALQAVSAGQIWKAIGDVRVSPTYLPHLLHACLDLLIDGENGIWHLANQADLSWYDFARLITDAAHLEPSRVKECSLAEMHLKAARPPYSVLGSERGLLLPSLDQAVSEFSSSLLLLQSL